MTMQRHNSGGSIWRGLFSDLSRNSPEKSQRGLIAFFKDKPISFNFSVRHGDTAFFFAEGTDREFGKLHSNRLLMWENIRWAKQMGSKQFHFGGGIDGSKEDSLYAYKLKFGKEFCWYRIVIPYTAKGRLSLAVYQRLPSNLLRKLKRIAVLER